MLHGPYLPDDPVMLSIASDHRFGKFHPQIDAVWQLHLKPDEPLWLGSSLGLQAQSLRLFPSFILQNQSFEDFSSFFSSPRVDLILSNYLRLSLALSPGLAVSFEAWAADSNRLLGRVELVNENPKASELEMDLTADLVPLSGAAGFTPVMHKFQSLLKAETGSLALALGMEGPARPMFSPLPALSWKASVPARSRLALQWRLVIETEMAAALAAATQAYPSNFPAEVARMLNRNRLDSVTMSEGEDGWAEVAASSQMLASQLVMGAETEAPAARQVLGQRNPNMSYPQLDLPATSLRKDNALHLLNVRQVLLGLPTGQSAQALQLFAAQMRAYEARGEGLNVLPFPCLADLAWQLFFRQQDQRFLETVYPALKDLTLAWFDQIRDHDRDGLPEWQQLAQTGLFQARGFDLMDSANQAAGISKTESAALAALLVDELSALEAMAQYLGDSATQKIAQSLRERTAGAVEAQAAQGVFGFWDRDTHQRGMGEMLYRGPAKGVNGPRYQLAHPQRLLIQIIPGGVPQKPLGLRVLGQDANGEAQEETLGAGQISWLPGYFFASTQKVYQRLERLDLDGENAQLVLYTPSLDGYSVADLLAYDENLSQAGWVTEAFDALAEETRFGLPEQVLAGTGVERSLTSNPAWNSLLISRLVKIGERGKAFQVLNAWVQAAHLSLSSEHALFEAAHAGNGRPQGNRSAAAGIVPIEVILQVAGVQFLSGEKVQIAGENPFPWPIGFRYRGLHVLRDGKNTRITFPNGDLQLHFGSVRRIFQAKPRQETPLPVEETPAET